MLHILRALHVAYSPASYPAERRRQTLRVLGVLNGLVYALAAVALLCLGWGLIGPRTQGDGPQDAIPVSDFSGDDLTGPLHEARLNGVLRIGDLRIVSVPSIVLHFDRPMPVVPLTGPDWQVGDPVQIFVINDWILPDRTDTGSVVAAFEKTGVLLDPANPAPLDLGLARYDIFDFDDAPDALLIEAGFAATSPVTLLQITDVSRPRLLKSLYDRYVSLGKIFGLMALVFGLAFIPAARNLRRFETTV